MAKPIIEVENVSKRYRIGAHKEPYLSLRDELAKLFSREGRRARKNEEEFWALRDVSFAVQQGEAVGIIGRNGAGKSTLLKILSQITPPTQGRITMRGRVASLLEVGTGFHPELTGRENIYLNGTILGMTRREVARKFDEIVAFAEIDKFLDTPVKRYSSGMYVRLAFAVAAHLEPEILIVDEVLAVGDAQFQKKCMGKMGDIGKQGRTILFVSHNMQALNSLCSKAIFLKNGVVEKEGASIDVIGHYLSYNNEITGVWDNPNADKIGRGVTITGARIINSKGDPSPIINYDEPFGIQIDYKINKRMGNWTLIARLTDSMGTVVFTSWDKDSIKDKTSIPNESYRTVCSVPQLLLRPGKYTISLGSCSLAPFNLIEYFENLFTMEITTIGYSFNEGRRGVIAPSLNWKIVHS